MTEEQLYSKFAQYYIEMVDNLNGLTGEVEELLSEGEVVPQRLADELHRIQICVAIITQTGEQQYGKSPKELYNDGWHFWFKEDAELREKRYGGKSKC